MGFGKSQARILTEWLHLIAGSEDEPGLANLTNRTKLIGIRERAFELLTEQAHHQAAKQVASRALNDLLDEGEDVARDLKAELRSQVGSRSEKLTQFHIKPLRTDNRRRRRSLAAQEAAEGPAAPASDSREAPEPE